jgi:hypothetical protein
VKLVSNQRLEQIVGIGDLWCGDPEMRSMAAELLTTRERLAGLLLCTNCAKIEQDHWSGLCFPTGNTRFTPEGK